MIDKNSEICVCNGLTAIDIANCIRENDLYTLKEIIENDICPVANKCEACIDEGFNNDGLNIPLVLSMVKKELI